MSNKITTYTKIHMDPFCPEESQISLEDIAHALSLICRANGHMKHFYSVGQHSVNCELEAKARGLSARVQLACLLHDASETYLCDITRPVKYRLPNYLELEEKMQEVVWRVFGLSDLSADEWAEVCEIDDAILYYEFIELKGERLEMPQPQISSSPRLDLMSFDEVKERFIRHTNRLLRCLKEE